MIVYSVTVNIDNEAHDEWLVWMKNKHIPDVMATGIFTDHKMLRVITRDAEEQGVSYNIQYTCPSMADLHQYQIKHAPALQKEHTDKFEGKFAAFRTLLETT